MTGAAGAAGAVGMTGAASTTSGAVTGDGAIAGTSATGAAAVVSPRGMLVMSTGVKSVGAMFSVPQFSQTRQESGGVNVPEALFRDIT